MVEDNILYEIWRRKMEAVGLKHYENWYVSKTALCYRFFKDVFPGLGPSLDLKQDC